MEFKLTYKISDLDCVNVVAFSRSGQYLAFGCDDGKLSIADTASGAIVRDIQGSVSVSSLLWHPFEENTLIIGYANNHVRLHSVIQDHVVSLEPAIVPYPTSQHNNSLNP